MSRQDEPTCFVRRARTRCCCVYACYEDAVVDDRRRVIHFLDSDDECDIA